VHSIEEMNSLVTAPAGEFRVSPVFDLSFVAGNLHDPAFVSCELIKNWPVICNVFNRDRFRLVLYLSITSVIFQVASDRLQDLAAALLARQREASNSYKTCCFIGLCADPGTWNSLVELCGHPDWLFVAPDLVPDVSLWTTFAVRAFVVVGEPDLSVLRSCPAWLVFTDSRSELVQKVADRLKEIPFPALPGELCRPAQPLGCDFDSWFYEDLEADVAKHDAYEAAIREAISRVPNAVVAVVGAGRGPLVDRAILAGAARVFAVEGNPAVWDFLALKKSQSWPDSIQIFQADMRTVELPEKVDILISDLLGSVGDDRLCPECLLGCERFLSPHAISVPTNVTSLIAPITSELIWTKALRGNLLNGVCLSKLTRYVALAEPQVCFEFSYPGQNQLYGRARMSFRVTGQRATLHGFLGWFDCLLFGDQKISNRDPARFAHCFFPLRIPFIVRNGEVIELSFERKTDGANVWCEWAVLAPEVSRIHNCGGGATRFLLNCEPSLA
jgi:protein arginine N-methyltransferase 5